MRVRQYTFVLVSLVANTLMMASLVAQDFPEMPVPAKEHKILARFSGEWDCESEAYMSPGSEPMVSKGKMTGRQLGEFWALIDLSADFGGMDFKAQGTFGYDEKAKRYIGTWVDNMTGFMWKYDGEMVGNKLVLNSEGPSMDGSGKMVKARDSWEFRDDNTLVLTGEFEGEDGKMFKVMEATFKRKQ